MFVVFVFIFVFIAEVLGRNKTSDLVDEETILIFKEKAIGCK